jgi:hypothetical protein
MDDIPEGKMSIVNTTYDPLTISFNTFVVVVSV